MRYFVTFLIVIGLVILGIILLIRALFGGGSGTVPNRFNLVSYANTSVIMRLSIEGAVTADQTYRSITIDVGTNDSQIDIAQGYQNHVYRSQSYNSNSEAYATFLRAIDILGYTNGSNSQLLDDDRGYCPTGNRYVFQILDGTTQKQRYWSTSCSSAPKSFLGQASAITNLFQAQIPDYDTLTSDVNLF